MILDGRGVSNALFKELKTKIENFEEKPRLDVILVGEDPASSIYVRNKIRRAKEINVDARLHLFDSITEDELLKLIDELNKDNDVDGILVQLPLPKGINEDRIVDSIRDDKDVDGFHLKNAGRLFKKSNRLTAAATPTGIMKLLEYYHIDVTGMNAVVIGRSNIVGMPLSKMLTDANATVTVCHSRTKDISLYTKTADLICVAIGSPNFLTKDMVKEGVIIVDVGINRVNGRTVGDVDFDNLVDKAKYITPVPGGVGPMTIYALFENLVKLYLLRRGER